MTRIEAIKIVRQYTSCGLVQARDLVLHLEALEVLACQDTPDAPAPAPVVHSHPGLEAVLARIATVLEQDAAPTTEEAEANAGYTTTGSHCSLCGDLACEDH